MRPLYVVLCRHCRFQVAMIFRDKERQSLHTCKRCRRVTEVTVRDGKVSLLTSLLS